MYAEIAEPEKLVKQLDNAIALGFKYGSFRFGGNDFSTPDIEYFKLKSEATNLSWSKNAFEENGRWVPIHLETMKQYIEDRWGGRLFNYELKLPLKLDAEELKADSDRNVGMQNVTKVEDKLIALGVPVWITDSRINYENDFLRAGDKIDFRFGMDRNMSHLNFQFHYKRDEEDEFFLNEFTATLVPLDKIAIPDVTVSGVNLKELDNKLSKFDWTGIEDDFDSDLVRWYENDKSLSSIHEDFENIKKARKSDQIIAGTVMFAHLAGKPLEYEIPFFKKVLSTIGIQQKFPVSSELSFNIHEAEKILNGASIYKENKTGGSDFGRWYYNSDRALQSIPHFDLEGILKNLDLRDMTNPSIINNTVEMLKHGEVVRTGFEHLKDSSLSISVNGAKGGILMDLGWLKAHFNQVDSHTLKMQFDRPEKNPVKGKLVFPEENGMVPFEEQSNVNRRSKH